LSVRCSVKVAPWHLSWLTPVSFMVSVPDWVTLCALPVGKLFLTTTAGIVKSGVPPLITVLHSLWAASAVMLDIEIVSTRCAPCEGLSTVMATGEEVPGTGCR
jgi:hypothetical protein